MTVKVAQKFTITLQIDRRQQTIFVIHRAGRSSRELSTVLRNSLDSFDALKSNHSENFAQRIPPCRRPYSGRTIVPKAMLYAQMSRWRPAGGCLSYHQRGRRWLTYSLSAPARVHQFQRVSEPSGFSSKAFLASLFRCAARPAVKCTNGTPRMRGQAP